MTTLTVPAWRALPAALLVALAATTAQAQQAPPPLRLAWLNAQAILAATPGRAAAESLFAREMAGFRTEVQRLQAQVDSSVAEYNRTQVALTPAARQQREEAIRQLQARAQQRAQELEQQATQREAELTAPIMQRVNAVIEGIRAEFNYSFVFDVSADNSIVTADRSLDITQLVIQRLQAAGPGAPPVPADSTRPAAATPPAAPAAAPPGPRVRPRP